MLNLNQKDLPMRFPASRLAILAGFAVVAVAAVALAQPPADFIEPKQQSFLPWWIDVNGPLGFMIFLTGLAVFIGACLMVALAPRPAIKASFLVPVLLPLIFTMLAVIKMMIASISVNAMSDEQLKASVVAAGWSKAMVLPLEALCVIIPSYLVLAIGLFVRTLRASSNEFAAHGHLCFPPQSR